MFASFCRDFAYVARDRNSRRFMCHVFRCDTPARTIANTLRDICKRLMLERRQQQSSNQHHQNGGTIQQNGGSHSTQAGGGVQRRVVTRKYLSVNFL